jgi:predicted RNA-binding protein YlqC (UPF0109 family)
MIMTFDNNEQYYDHDSEFTDEEIAQGLEILENRARTIVESVVDEVDAIDIKCAKNDNILMIIIQGAWEECSKIIGQGGKTINAIRVVLYAIARKHGCYVKIEVHSSREKEKQAQKAKFENDGNIYRRRPST